MPTSYCLYPPAGTTWQDINWKESQWSDSLPSLVAFCVFCPAKTDSSRNDNIWQLSSLWCHWGKVWEVHAGASSSSISRVGQRSHNLASPAVTSDEGTLTKVFNIVAVVVPSRPFPGVNQELDTLKSYCWVWLMWIESCLESWNQWWYLTVIRHLNMSSFIEGYQNALQTFIRPQNMPRNIIFLFYRWL